MIECRPGVFFPGEPIGLVSGCEPITVAFTHRADNPEVLRHERLYLLLPVNQQGQRRALYPTRRQELLPTPFGSQRDEPGKHGAPDEVYVLPGLSCPRQVLLEASGVCERLLYLGFG